MPDLLFCQYIFDQLSYCLIISIKIETMVKWWLEKTAPVTLQVRYTATKMFIIKHLTFLLHLHSLSFLEGSFKFSLIKARLSSCRRLIYSYKNDTTLHKLNRFTIFYLCLMSGKRNTCLYSKFKLSFSFCRFV